METPRSMWTPKAISAGLFLVLLGAWGAMVPLVGPYFDFGFDTQATWTLSERHWMLSLGPGLAAAVGGLMLIMRPTAGSARLGGLLAAAAGIWFVIGPSLYPLWGNGQVQPLPVGDVKRTLLWIGYFYGTGALITFFAGFTQELLWRRVSAAEEALVVERTEQPTRRRQRVIMHP